MLFEEVLSRYYSLVDEQDFSTLVHMFAENCTYERPGFPTIQGRAELFGFYNSARPIRESTHTVVRTVEEGGRCVCFGEVVAALTSGDLVRIRFSDLFEIVEGLIQSRVTYFFVPAI